MPASNGGRRAATFAPAAIVTQLAAAWWAVLPTVENTATSDSCPVRNLSTADGRSFQPLTGGEIEARLNGRLRRTHKINYRLLSAAIARRIMVDVWSDALLLIITRPTIDDQVVLRPARTPTVSACRAPLIACFGAIKILTLRKRNNDLHAWTDLDGSDALRPSAPAAAAAGTVRWSFYDCSYYGVHDAITMQFCLAVCHNSRVLCLCR